MEPYDLKKDLEDALMLLESTDEADNALGRKKIQDLIDNCNFMIDGLSGEDL